MDIFIYSKEMWQLALEKQPQGIWYWVAVYSFLLCGYSLLFQIRTRFWPSVDGELVTAEVEKVGGTDLVKSNQDYMAKGLYVYTVAGKQYQGTRISPWIFVASHNARFVLEKQLSLIKKYPDGKVRVYYNPRNPKKSYLVVAGMTGIFITLGLSTLPLLIYILSYHL